ncbi:LCP family protein [Actinomadura fulvescens]|uniref:LytR family transcriptional regulator n=1 Tax=Actinomadura fulvescens TaxID=46160 RepID=A0ABP6BVE4_9ACTN
MTTITPPRALAWISIALAGVIVATTLAAYGYYWRIQNSIQHEDPNKLITGERPRKLNDALNILLIGSDTREGANAQYGRSLRDKAPASDTMILLHLSPGGGQALGISFARDLMVPIPACKRKDGSRTPASSLAMLNEAIGRAGPTCTMDTIEKLTHIKIDHFVQVDFVGFEKITTAVGGVPICLTKPVYDPEAGLRLGKGPHRVAGKQALAYVRARKKIGDGSDTQRIQRQQQFLGSLAKQALTGGVLTSPGRLNALLTASAESLTTDRDLTPSRILKIAQGMRDLTAGKVRFVTVPDEPYALDHDRRQLAQPAAARFLTAVRNDEKISDVPAATAKTNVEVRVLNGSGAEGQARLVADSLRDRAFTVSKVGNLSRPTATTQIRYGRGAAAQAAAIAALIPRAGTVATARVPAATIEVILGANFPGLKSTGIPRQQNEHRASDDICRENPA